MMEKMAGNMIIAIMKQMGVDPDQLKSEVMGHVSSFKSTFDTIEARLARIEKALNITEPLIVNPPGTKNHDSQPGTNNSAISPPAFPGSTGIGNYQGPVA